MRTKNYKSGLDITRIRHLLILQKKQTLEKKKYGAMMERFLSQPLVNSVFSKMPITCRIHLSRQLMRSSSDLTGGLTWEKIFQDGQSHASLVKKQRSTNTQKAPFKNFLLPQTDLATSTLTSWVHYHSVRAKICS